jgi:tetratricopeptide (TPR) repeat protein
MQNKNNLSAVPQSNNNWYVFHSLLRAWIAEENKEPYRPTLFIVMDAASQFILNFELLEEPPTIEKSLEVIFSTITNPKAERAPSHRPKTIKFEDKQLMENISAQLAEIGITTRYAPNRKMSGAIIRDFESHTGEGHIDISGLSAKPGITPQVLHNFYKAAAEFFRAAPWVYLSDNNPLMINISPHEPYYVNIMGQAGMEYGMIVFKTREALEAFRQSAYHDHPDIPATGWHALDFEEKYGIPFDDLDELELHDYEIASPNAYPMPISYFVKGRVDRPPREMIYWYQAAMQAITRFVDIYFKSPPSALIEETSFIFDVAYGNSSIEAEIGYPVPGIARTGYAPPVGFGSPMEMVDFGGPGHDDLQLRRAQEFIQQAWEEDNPQERVMLAQKALSISKYCVDAYVLLGDDFALDNHDRLSYYQQGVEAGEKFLGSTYFEENEGHFWGFIETRPYMRALSGVSNCLWILGERKKAIATLRRMLRLNPGDNQGIRYFLLHTLLEIGSYEEAGSLIKQFNDAEDAPWLFTKALLKFKESGPSAAADKLLMTALNYNPYVKEYLTGAKRIPNFLPPTHGFGDEPEALDYVDQHLNHWRRVEGAVDWLTQLEAD